MNINAQGFKKVIDKERPQSLILNEIKYFSPMSDFGRVTVNTKLAWLC